MKTQLFNKKTGEAIAVKEDGTVFERNLLSGKWIRRGRVKEGILVEAFIQRRLDNGWIPYRMGMVPSWRRIEKMCEDGIAKATDGCQVEPDGTCQHGFPSWVIVAGVI